MSLAAAFKGWIGEAHVHCSSNSFFITAISPKWGMARTELGGYDGFEKKLVLCGGKGKIAVRSNDLEYVGFWPRVGASVIDMLLQLAIMLPLTYAVYGRFSQPGRMFMGFGDFFLNMLVPAAAVIAFWVYKSATPGKMALSARIVDADTGAPLTISQSVTRYLGYVVSLVPLGVGFFWIGFDRRKQGWHDKMANSVVVRPGGVEPVKFRSNSDWRNPPQEPRF